eukprot:TRINITY_DN5783_c0_g1_i1.p1 TRINITY_DN5783_c0_g1~~TRINITY_DN5783_c0_g1_i1.p1  ORF type:complete len:147 (+),score=19.01 TRINITY_DN5783_c0_g1_i1:27-443(+)
MAEEKFPSLTHAAFAAARGGGVNQVGIDKFIGKEAANELRQRRVDKEELQKAIDTASTEEIKLQKIAEMEEKNKKDEEELRKLIAENQEALRNYTARRSAPSLGFKLDLFFYTVMFIIIYVTFYVYDFDFGVKLPSSK